MTTIRISHPALFSLLVSATRYALGRATYVVGDTAGYVRAYGKHLTADELGILHRDVTEAIDDAARLGTLVGHRCDHDEWVRLQAWLAEAITEKKAEGVRDILEKGERRPVTVADVYLYEALAADKAAREKPAAPGADLRAKKRRKQ